MNKSIFAGQKCCQVVILIHVHGNIMFCSIKLETKLLRLHKITATNPSPSSHIPVGLNFLFRNFESKI